VIIRLIIQTIRRDPSGSVWIDEASNVSRPDPSGADHIDAEHQATDLMPERRQGRPLVHERAAGATAPLRCVGLYAAHRAGPRRLLATSSRHRPHAASRTTIDATQYRRTRLNPWLPRINLVATLSANIASSCRTSSSSSSSD